MEMSVLPLMNAFHKKNTGFCGSTSKEAQQAATFTASQEQFEIYIYSNATREDDKTEVFKSIVWPGDLKKYHYFGGGENEISLKVNSFQDLWLKEPFFLGENVWSPHLSCKKPSKPG